MLRKLIVNADDFGLTPGVSRGILAAHRHGIVTSSTVLVTGDVEKPLLAEARDQGLKLGLHVNFTLGKPLTHGGSLVGSEGRFVREAYADRALPIDCGQTISQPFMVAYMTEQLRVWPDNRVLEVGTGSGYQAAVLSRLAREVITVERYRTLADRARARLAALGCDNVDVIVGDGFAGVSDRAPFDRIIVTAAAEQVPKALTEQLADGGVMLLPLGPHGGTQQLVKLTKSARTLARETLLPVRFVPLVPGQAREL